MSRLPRPIESEINRRREKREFSIFLKQNDGVAKRSEACQGQAATQIAAPVPRSWNRTAGCCSSATATTNSPKGGNKNHVRQAVGGAPPRVRRSGSPHARTRTREAELTSPQILRRCSSRQLCYKAVLPRLLASVLLPKQAATSQRGR